MSEAELSKILSKVNKTRGFSRHAIIGNDGLVFDHFTKESAAKKKERSRKQGKARRQARKANR